jgi:hypothetical protein
LAFFVCIVNIFVMPAEIGNLYFREGKARPVSAVTGFWIFLPIVGWFVWVVKCQRRLNEFWIAHGASAISGSPSTLRVADSGAQSAG